MKGTVSSVVRLVRGSGTTETVEGESEGYLVTVGGGKKDSFKRNT